MYNWIGNKLYQLSTSAPYNNVMHINMKMASSKWWGKRGRGMILSYRV